MNNANDTTQSGSPLFQMPIDQQGVTDSPTFAPPRPTVADVPPDPGGPIVTHAQVGHPFVGTIQQEPSPRDAAQMLLGDASLESGVKVVNGRTYIDGIAIGPPARWAADPNGRV